MSELTAFFQANIIPIYFIYGLAHFVMGLAVALETGRNTQLGLSRALPFLAAFGITHGINEWVEMFSMISMHIPMVQEPRWAEMFKLGWKALSFFFLFEFGARLLIQLSPSRKRWLWSLPKLTLILWIAGALAMYLRGLPFEHPQPGLASMWTNYVLGVPGSITAVIAMLAQRRAFLHDEMPQFGRDLVGAALAIGWYSVLDQIIDDPAALLPSSLIHKDVFLTTFGMPVEIFRTLAVSFLAFCVIRMLRVFEVEYARRLDAANQARFRAQEDATRELVVMFETCRILGTSLDVNQLIHDSLTKIVQLLDPMIAGSIFLYDSSSRTLALKAYKVRPEQFSFSSLESNFETRAAQQAFDTGQIAYESEPVSGTSFVAVPLVSQEKKIGALCLAHREAFSNYAVIHTLARQLGIALENAQLYSEVQEKERLRGQLLERAVAAQEEERKRIARELHDETGQMLTALAAGLGGIEQTIVQNLPLAQSQLGELKVMTMHATDNLRQFVSDLRPSLLDDMGLVPAVRWLGKEYKERGHFEVEIQVTGNKRRLPPQIETVLFRIAQEALNNVARHAHASRVCILLNFVDGSALLSIEDNGKGFVVEEILGTHSERRAWGLLGMQERLGLVGGKFNIESTPGKGTRLAVEIPLITEGEVVVEN
jgi:signal transduction histidine kinase